MNWKSLESPADLAELLEHSYHLPQIIFKHSTRCGTSSLAKNRLQHTGEFELYLLDVIAHRDLSNKIAADLNVWHESPQVLIVHKGQCTYDESHLGINLAEIKDQYDELVKN